MLQNSFSHCPQSWPSLSSLSPTPSSKQKQGSEMSSSLFTVVQWQELEHQALIFKYFKAGLPVPPDLLAPIRRSFQFMSPSLFSQPASLGYCSYFGKKIDPEPGRCRRTDGKKWRCSKEAHPDSKYCERHMNRGRYRSRKLVELRTTNSQSLSAASSDVPTGSSSSSTGSLQKTPLHSTGNSKSLCFGSKTTKLQVDHFPYGISNNEYRGVRGMNVESGKHNFLAEISGSVRGVRTDSGDESSWCFPASQIPFLSSESRSRSLLLSSNQQQTFQDIEQPNVDALVSKQEQHCFFGKEIDMPLSAKQEHNMLQPLCDQWPKTRDLVSHPDDHRSSKDLVTTTQLSMSSSTSDFFTRNAQSPSDALRRT